MGFFRRRKKDEDDDIIEGEIEEIEDDEASASADEVDDEAPARPGLFRRGKRRQSTIHESPRQPLERVAPDIPTPESGEPIDVPPAMRSSGESEFLDAEAPIARRRRLRLPRLLVWRDVRPGLLLLAIGMVAGGIFWTQHNLGQTTSEVEMWWPLAMLVMAGLWALVALIARQGGAFLAASALIGVSISLLLDTQDLMAWRETLVGSVLIVLGIGIVARGLLLRQGSIAQ